MAKIVFRGKPHFRVLTAADLKSRGVEVEFSKTSFPRNTPVEVDDAVADAILGDKAFGKFEVLDERTDTEQEADKSATEAREQIAGASAQGATGAPSTTTTKASTRAR